MTVWAKITTRFAGLHHYPNAPRPVEFLGVPHRHEFHVTLWIEQHHNERDIEYLQAKRDLHQMISLLYNEDGNDEDLVDLADRSCETIAEELATVARTHYASRDDDDAQPRKIRVEVLEDGENGAVVEL